MSHFEIREATKKDIPAILSLIKELAEFEKLSSMVIATEDSLSSALFGENTVASVLIGELDLKPISFALYFSSFSTFLAKPGIYLEDLYVQPEYRSKGYGKLFFSELIKIAKENNCGRVEWSVLNWNKKAISFYERLGAKAQDEWMVYRITL